MTFHAGASLFITLSSLALGIFVYLAGKRKAANVTLALYTLSVAAWSFGQFMTEMSSGKAEALFWSRIHLGASIFIPILYLHFVLAFLNRENKRKRVLFPAYLFGLLLLFTAFTPFFVSDVTSKVIFKYYPVPGAIFPLFTIFFFLLIAYGFYELFYELRESLGRKRNQIIYILLASIIGFAGGSMMFLPVYGLKILPIGYYFVPIYILLAVYAIVRHRLLDINIVIRKGLVYSTLMLIFTVVYIGAIIMVKEIFQTITGLNSTIATIAVLFGFSAFFQPLRQKIEEGVDYLFFKGKYDYQKTLKDLSQASTSILNLDKLVAKTLKTIMMAMRLNRASILLIGDENLPPNSSLARYFQVNKEVVFADEVNSKEIRDELERLSATVCIPMVAKGKLVGIFVLGEKFSGEMYTSGDIDLLSTLANQVAIAVENAKLHEDILNKEREIFQRDKLASLGTLAAGMAHEIKNPLASIKGLTQILPENYEDSEFRNKFVEIIPRQLDRINNIVEDLLQFGKPSSYIKREIDLNYTLESVLKLVERQCMKGNINIIKELKPLDKIYADSEALNQAFMNLILNAIQAMPSGGMLRISSDCKDGDILVEISDTGIGIPDDTLKNIFDPFFTTKDRGAGLGLSITYRIIKEHGGEIEVESKRGEGTRFKVRLVTTQPTR